MSSIDGDRGERAGFLHRGRRRRANVVGGRRYQHQVKVTAEEEARLLVLAERNHVTVPRLLVESALAGERGETVADRQSLATVLFGLHRLLASIANNVNQVARATNATGELQPQMAAVLVSVRRTAERIDAAVDRVTS